MKIGVSVKIDVTKIDKDRLFQGQKGTYLDLTTFIDIDEKDQYDNNGFIAQSVSKEEKANGVKLPILGNVKVFFTDNQQQYQQPQQYQQQPQQQQYQRAQQFQQPQQGHQINAPQNFDPLEDDIPF